MKDSLRQCMAWLHTWTGLVVGWALFFIFVTGTPGYFQHEITDWMQPERAAVHPQNTSPADLERMTQLGLARLAEVAPETGGWQITFPHLAAFNRKWQEFGVRWEDVPKPGHDFGASTSEKLDPFTGAVKPPELEPRPTAGGGGLYRMHYLLHYIPYPWAIRIVGVCTMLMLLAIVSGVITHKKIFKDFFTFRPGKGQRSWLDAHNAVSVMALPFFLMITYSGLVFFMYAYAPAGRDVIYGSRPDEHKVFFNELFDGDRRHAAVGLPTAALGPMLALAYNSWGVGQVASISAERHEGEPAEIIVSRIPVYKSLDFWEGDKLRFDATTGDRLQDEPKHGGNAVLTQSVVFNLHEGHFTRVWGRWLYVVAGLLGCAMIGTGLVLWTVKRRKSHLGSGREHAENFSLRLVENLNVATIAGLPLAVAAYFLANRLIPVDMPDRAAWEFHSLFAVWLGTLLYAFSRPLARAWIELFWGCCLAYALIPIVNAFTTNRHLGQSVSAGDWVFAGFDLSMLALSVMFAYMAVKVRRRLAPKPPPALSSLITAKATP